MSVEPSDIIDIEENTPIEEEPAVINKEEINQEDNKQEDKQEDKAPCNSLSNDNNTENKNKIIKEVKQLTKQERQDLINNAKKGISNENYKVTFMKNGQARITKINNSNIKQSPKQNTAQKLIETRQTMMTNEQLLMEHVIGLETQLAVMRNKHKRLKDRYKQLAEDIYINDYENNYEEYNNDNSPANNDSVNNDNNNYAPVNNSPVNYSPQRYSNNFNQKVSWRNKLYNNLR